MTMKMVFYRYGSICEPDYLEAFEMAGLEVVCIEAEISDKNLKPSDTAKLVSDALVSGDVGFVFTINFYPVISEVCERFGIRYLCQSVDSPVFELYADSISNSWNRIFVFDSEQYRELEPRNPGHVFHLALATNTSRWDQVIGEASEDTKKRFSADVSFVGSLYTEKCPYDDYDGKDDYLNGYLDGMMHAQMGVYGAYFLEQMISDDTVRRFREHVKGFYQPPESIRIDDKKIMARHYLDARISVMERLEVMRRLGEEFDVSLYTRSDATGLPVRDCGGCQTLTEMPIIFNQSKVNLNITTKGIREGLSLRIFDVLGCGGFLITNYQTELPAYFSIGEDLEMYTDMDDLVEKTAYYLSHEEERCRIARSGYEKVKTMHNHLARVVEMIDAAFGKESKQQSGTTR